MMRALPMSRPLVEWGLFLVGAVLAVCILALKAGEIATVATIAVAVGAFVVWIAWQDIKHFTISDAAVMAIAAIAIAARWDDGRLVGESTTQALMAAALDAFLPGLVLLAFREIYFRRKGHDGLGLGDVKLGAAGGILVGTVGFSWALFVASLAALTFVAARQLANKPFAKTDRLAFGAVLAPALWAVWIVEQTPILLAGS